MLFIDISVCDKVMRLRISHLNPVLCLSYEKAENCSESFTESSLGRLMKSFNAVSDETVN